jgi:flagellar biosynthesis/type III secretory pathway chaperone
MGSLRERITAFADASANLLAQLNELDELRERVRKAQRSTRPTQATKKVRQHDRRILANRRQVSKFNLDEGLVRRSSKSEGVSDIQDELLGG